MPKGGLLPEEKEKVKQAPWTQEDTDKLHILATRYGETLEEIAEEYEKMEWLKRKGLRALIWVVGIPAALVYFFEPLEKVWKMLIRLKGP